MIRKKILVIAPHAELEIMIKLYKQKLKEIEQNSKYLP